MMEMSRFDNSLAAILHRAFCPNPHELGEYQLGIIDNDRATFIRQHLADCPHCRAELGELQIFLADNAADLGIAVQPASEESLADRLKVWIASLLPDLPSGGLGMQPAFGLRGSGEKVRFYQAGEAQLALEVQDDPQQPGRKTVLGLLTGLEPAGCQAHLARDGQPLGVVDLDELGNFVLAKLEPGRYELILACQEAEIHIQELEI
jgi:hypothetical protein